MFCTNCGSRHEPAAAFCGHCGARLAIQGEACPQTVPGQSVYQVQSWPSYPQVQVVKKSKLPGRGWGIAGLVLSLVALVLGVFWEISAVAALLGMAFSSLSLAKAAKVGKSNGLAVGGMICGIVALVIAIIIGILSSELLSAAPDAGMDYYVYM